MKNAARTLVEHLHGMLHRPCFMCESANSDCASVPETLRKLYCFHGMFKHCVDVVIERNENTIRQVSGGCTLAGMFMFMSVREQVCCHV